MANAVKIANLQIEISDNSQTAIKSLSEFIEILKSMKEATSGNLGLSKVSSGLKKINEAGTDGIEALATSLAKAVAPAEKLAESLSHVSRALSSIKGSKSLSSAMQTAEKLQTQANTARNTNTRTGLTNDTSGTWNNTAQQTQQVNNALAEFQQRAELARQTLAQIEMRDDLARGISEWTREAQRAYGASGKLKEAFLSVGRFGSEVFNNILPSGVSRLISQFGRMARMKVLRTIISSLMQGFSQGLQNAYYWAKATGDQFATSMDTISTSMNYAKNSIGAAFSSVLNIIAPAIDKVVDWLVVGINYINMFFATLSGASTYMKAKKVAVEYGTAAAGAIGGASAAAKDLKEQLSVLDFDELNQLQDQSASSGGGGGGGGAGGGGTNYGDMFEQAAIEQNWLTKTATWLQDNFETILDIVKAIGAGILAWKVADAFSNTIKELDGLKKLGIATLVVGVVLSYEGGYNMGRDGFSVKNIVETLLGTGLSAIGGAMVWGAEGVVIGISASIVATVTGFVRGKIDAAKEIYQASDLYPIIQADLQRAVSANQYWVDLTAKIKNISIENDERVQQVTVAKDILEQVKKFDGMKITPEIDTTGLDTLIQMYNDMDLTDVELKWSNLNGYIQTNADLVMNALQAYDQYIRTIATEDLLKSTYQDYANALIEQQNQTRARDEVGDRLNMLLDNYAYTSDWASDIPFGAKALMNMLGVNPTWTPGQKANKWAAVFNPEAYAQQLAINDELKAYQELDQAVKSGDTAVDAIKQQIVGLYEQLGITGVSFDDLGGSAAGATTEIEGLTHSVPIVSHVASGIGITASLPFNTSSSNTVTNTTKNNTVNSSTWSADVSGLAIALGVVEQYSGEVQTAYTAEQRAQAYQIAYEQGFYNIANQIKNGGAEAQKYTGYILENANAMKMEASTTNDAATRIKTYTPAVQLAGDASQKSAGQVGMINTALGNVGKGVSYQGIATAIASNFSAQNWSSIGNGMKTGIENALATTGKNFNYSTVSNGIKTGFVNAVAASNFAQVGTNVNSYITGNNGLGKLASSFNYTSSMGAVKAGFANAAAAQPFSAVGRSINSDITGNSGLGQLPSSIGYWNTMNAVKTGFANAAWQLPFSEVGRSIGNDIKSGVASSLSWLTVKATVNGISKSIAVATSVFAEGGYPEAGSLFIAGEAGAEAVGTIGGKTGVANRDQIASAIAMALKPMLGGQNQGGSETVNVTMKMDSATVAKASMKGQRAMNKQYNITAQA